MGATGSGDPLDDGLIAALEAAQGRSWIGRAPLEVHIAHAEAFLDLLPADHHRLVDLGPGGGLPSLVLLARRPDLVGLLVERSTTRADALRLAVERLGWGDRVRVLAEDAAVTGRRDEERGSHDVVVARGFGPPAVVAECASPLLRAGGRLIVAAPPGGAPERWDPASLASLGLELRTSRIEPVALTVLEQVRLCGPAWPRRSRAMQRAPLF